VSTASTPSTRSTPSTNGSPIVESRVPFMATPRPRAGASHHRCPWEVVPSCQSSYSYWLSSWS
jgi:hypothetical protein